MAEGGAADVAMQPPAKFVLKTHEALGLVVVMLGLFCDCALLVRCLVGVQALRPLMSHCSADCDCSHHAFHAQRPQCV